MKLLTNFIQIEIKKQTKMKWEKDKTR